MAEPAKKKRKRKPKIETWTIRGSIQKLSTGEIVHFADIITEGFWDENNKWHPIRQTEKFYLTEEEYNRTVIQGISSSLSKLPGVEKVTYIPSGEEYLQERVREYDVTF